MADLDFKVFNLHGLPSERLGSPVQSLHILVVQVHSLITVSNHQLQILNIETRLKQKMLMNFLILDIAQLKISGS